MAKLPKDHPTIVKLRKMTEWELKHAKQETKRLNNMVASQLRIIFDKQLAKHKDKTEKLLKKLEIIASRKKN
jgi:hypothetical protein